MKRESFMCAVAFRAANLLNPVAQSLPQQVWHRFPTGVRRLETGAARGLVNMLSVTACTRHKLT
jgi:hypothetical protein